MHHNLVFQKLVFEEIQQEVILLLGEKKSEDKGIQVIELTDLDDLKELDLNNFYNYEMKELNHSTEKWIKYYLTNREINLIRRLRESEKIPFTTELFEINVGLVSGENSFFLLNRNTVDEVLGTLTEREQKVLKLRFGLEDGRARTLEEVGKEFKVTRERIRQIEAKALRKLRHPSRSRKLKDYLE